MKHYKRGEEVFAVRQDNHCVGIEGAIKGSVLPPGDDFDYWLRVTMPSQGWYPVKRVGDRWVADIRHFRRKRDGVVAIGCGDYVYVDSGSVIACDSSIETSDLWEEVFLFNGVFLNEGERYLTWVKNQSMAASIFSSVFSPPKSTSKKSPTDELFETLSNRMWDFAPAKARRWYRLTDGQISTSFQNLEGEEFTEIFDCNKALARYGHIPGKEGYNVCILPGLQYVYLKVSPPVCASREYREGAFTSDKHFTGCPNTGFPGKDCECCQERWRRGEELVTTLEGTYHKQYKDSHQGSAAFAHAIGIVKKFINGKKQA